MGPDDLKRFYDLRSELFEAIRRQLARESHCKSYEGAMSIQFPGYFETNDQDAEGWAVWLHCYVIGPARRYEWRAKTFGEALAKAETDIRSWIAANDRGEEMITEKSCESHQGPG